MTTGTIAGTPRGGLPTPPSSQARSSPCRFLGNNYASWVIITNRSSRIVRTYVYVVCALHTHMYIPRPHRTELCLYREREHQVRTTKTDGLVNLLAARILSFSHSTFSFSNTTGDPLGPTRPEIYRLTPKNADGERSGVLQEDAIVRSAILSR